MSNKSIWLISVLIITAIFAIGCSSSEEDTGAQTEQAAEAPAADTGQPFEQAKAAYVSTVKSALEDWNQKIDALGEKKSALPEMAQTPLEAPMKELTDMRDVLGAKIDALETSSEADYTQAQSVVDRELGAINTAYDKVSGMLK